MSDNDDIRALIHRWAEAVHDGDLDTVLADHTDDIVMFDVPPPHRPARAARPPGLRSPKVSQRKDCRARR